MGCVRSSKHNSNFKLGVPTRNINRKLFLNNVTLKCNMKLIRKKKYSFQRLIIYVNKREYFRELMYECLTGITIYLFPNIWYIFLNLILERGATVRSSSLAIDESLEGKIPSVQSPSIYTTYSDFNSKCRFYINIYGWFFEVIVVNVEKKMLSTTHIMPLWLFLSSILITDID